MQLMRTKNHVVPLGLSAVVVMALLALPAGAADSVRSLDNPAAIVFADFPKLEPPGAVLPERRLNHWFYRTGARFMAVGDAVLHVGPGDDVPDLVYAPGLTGRYNLYVGLRGVSQPTGLQLKTTGMKNYATIRLPIHSETVHINYDILWAANIPMDGQRITIHADTGLGVVYLDYLAFVPVDRDPNRAVPPSFVSYGSRRNGLDLSKFLDPTMKRHYEDARPLPPLAAASRDRGFVLFKRPWMDLVFPNSRPAEDPGNIRLTCALAQDEYEPTVFCLHAVRPLRNVSVELSVPPRNGARVFPRDRIDIRRVRCLVKRTSRYTGTSEYMDMPTYAETENRHDIPAGETREYWLTVHAPADAAPGTYEGRITVVVAGRPAARIPLVVVVHPFRLAPLKGYNFGMYYAPSGLTTGNALEDELREAFADMKAHGMNSVGWFGGIEARLNGTPAAPRLDLDASRLDAVVRAFRAAGLDGDLLCCCTDDPIQRSCRKLLPDEKAFEQAYVAAFRQLLAGARKRGWPRLLVQVFDEAPSNPDCFPELIRELRCLKKAGVTTEHDHMWIKTNRGKDIQRQIDQCVDNIDIFTLRYSGKPVFYVDPWPEIIRQAGRMGRTVYTYNINNGLAVAELETMRFGAGWFFRSIGRGCKGYYLWAYQQAAGSCYNDFGGHTDYLQQYPASARSGTRGGPALYWEALREGIDDLRYILTLEGLIERYRNDRTRADRVKSAEKLLARLADSVDTGKLQKECTFLECRWEKSWTAADGRRMAAGRFGLPNGWRFEDYDKARNAVATAIVRLLETPAPHGQ